jgi:hypothetical protein
MTDDDLRPVTYGEAAALNARLRAIEEPAHPKLASLWHLRPVTVTEAAFVANCSEAAIRREVAAGRLRCLAGSSDRLLRMSFDAWIVWLRQSRDRLHQLETLTVRERLAGMTDCPLRAENVRGLAATPGLCWLCGSTLPRRRSRWCSDACRSTWLGNHYWNLARGMRLRTDQRQCVTCGSRSRLEVNHRTPLVGTGYSDGCVHHQDGLETLCHACHVIETTRQRRARRGEHFARDRRNETLPEPLWGGAE